MHAGDGKKRIELRDSIEAKTYTQTCELTSPLERIYMWEDEERRGERHRHYR